MNEPLSNEQNEQPKNGAESPDQQNLLPQVNAAPNDQVTHAPATDTNNKRGPSGWSKISEASLVWLRHYWDSPRHKSKWTEVAIVVLTLVIAGAAIYSAWIFQGQLTLASSDARSSSRHLREQLRIVQTQADAAQEQATLMQQYLAGAMGAKVRFSPDMNHVGLRDENEVAMVLVNDGKVFSPKVQLDLTATKVSIPDLRVLSQLPPYSQSIPQLPLGEQGAGAPYKVRFKLEPDFSLQKESIKFEGTLRFGDGFGGRFEQRFCFVYVGAFNVKTNVGSDSNGSGFVETDGFCNGLRERLQRAHSYLSKQP